MVTKREAEGITACTNCMKACIEWFDAIGYAGVGRHGLALCVAAFEEGDRQKAVEEYRSIIGEAANFASAIKDLNTSAFSAELYWQHSNRVLAVMMSMSLLMGGEAK